MLAEGQEGSASQQRQNPVYLLLRPLCVASGRSSAMMRSASRLLPRAEGGCKNGVERGLF